MKHVLTIEDENSISELYVDNSNGQNRFLGYTVEGNELKNFDIAILKKLYAISLGQNREILESIDGYDRILDRDTGLLHFFKDGKEDLTKLLYENGNDAALCDNRYKRYRGKGIEKAEKIKLVVKNLTLIISATSMTLFTFLLGFLFALELSDIPIPIKGEWVDVSDSVSYIFSLEDKDLFGDLEEETIMNLIYTSNNINNEVVKDFLWNKELVESVLPYYEGKPLEIISKFRHKNLNPTDMTVEDGIIGRYKYTKDLFTAGYDEDTFSPDSKQARTLAHEYIHMLQTNSNYSFITEASAELMAHEFFFASSNSKDEYSYSRACTYLRILMELIGPEPIWEVNFKQGSTALEDSIRPYLDDADYEAFLSIMSSHPHYQSEDFAEYYPLLERLLDTMCKNKYGTSIYDRGLLSAILKNDEYDRPYFSKSLIESKDSYYMVRDINTEEALEEGLLCIYTGVEITYEQFSDDTFFKGANKDCSCIPSVVLKRYDLYVENNKLKGTVTLNDGTVLSAEEAIAQKIVYPRCSFFYEVGNVENFKKYGDYAFWYISKAGTKYDEGTGRLTFNEPYKKVIPSILEKFEERPNYSIG